MAVGHIAAAVGKWALSKAFKYIRKWRQAAMMAHLLRKAQSLANERARLVADTAKMLVSKPYPPASAAGEPPHLREGDLQESIGWRPGRIGKCEAFVYANSPHARILEEGTRLMEPRPFMRPAIARCRRRFTRIVLR